MFSRRGLGFGLLAYGIALLPVCVASQSDPPGTMQQRMQMMEETSRELRRMIPIWMDSAGVPGIAVGVAWRGQVVGGEGFGIRNSESMAPVDPETVFEVSTLSLPVFSYAVLQLVDQGVLDLDRPLAEYLRLDSLAEDERYWMITARQVLSHSSGLSGGMEKGSLEVHFTPGTRFDYSPVAYRYLAKVVEKLTGQNLEALMNELVFEPLEMTSTSFFWQDNFDMRFAVGHDEDGNPQRREMSDQADVTSSLRTTALDYARFLAAAQSREGLSPKSGESWMMPQVEVNDSVSWGLGWGMQESNGVTAAWQHGDNGRFNAFTLQLPQQEFGIVVLTNSKNGMSVMQHILAAIVPSKQPGLDWAGYESFNDARRVVRLRLVRVLRQQGVDAALEEYHELKRHYPSEAFVEPLLNRIGYRMMREKRLADAIAILLLNTKEYPEGWNAHDSLAEAYVENGDVKLAIAAYERSLELNPKNENGRQQLRQLRGRL